MADSIDLQPEELMTLVTDALRAGPRSAEWSQAVNLLRESNQNVDEYALLCKAREELDAGREYRSVRAGAGFTRKLMDGLEQGGKSRGPSTAAVIASLAGLVIVGAVIMVLVMALKSSGPNSDQRAIDELQNTIFGNRLSAASFSNHGGEPSEGWKHFGELPVVVVSNSLRPTTQPTPGSADAYKAGGWVIAQPIAADQPFEVDANIKDGPPANSGMIQLFVSDESVTDANAAGGHALVWQLKDGDMRVFLPNGNISPTSEKLGGQKDFTVRLRLNKEQAIVDASDKRLYAGTNLLAVGKARYVGIRFLRHGGENWDHLAVTSLLVQKP